MRAAVGFIPNYTPDQQIVAMPPLQIDRKKIGATRISRATIV